MEAPMRPSAVVLVEEQGRALVQRDVRDVLNGLPLVTLPVDPQVARAIDAGLLGARLPGSLSRRLAELGV
jgi:hypothetical protein